MSQHNFRKKVAETCRFWREGKCQKREYQCNFVHGFICPNDGRCWKEHCNKVHLQKKIMPPRDYFPKAHMNYQRPGPRQRFRRSHSRSLSPQRHRKVPQRGRSPLRRRSRSRSPTYHTRVYSPYQRRSRSPSPYRGGRRSRSRTQSPVRGVRRSRSRSLSPMRGARRSRSRSWSPSRGVRKSRSRSLSPLRSIRRSRSRSQSPLRGPRRGASPLRRRTRSRSRSGSWRRSRSLSASRPRSRNRSQGKIMSRSPSPIRFRSKSRGVVKLYSRSPSPQPKRRSRSSSSNSSSGSSQSNKRSPSRTFSHGHTDNSSPSSLKDKNLKPVQTKSNNPVPEVTDSGGSSPQRNSSNAGRRMQLDLENLYDNLECETSQKSAASETLDKEAAEKEAISKLQAQLAKDFMNPETQKLMEKVLSLTKENTINSLQPEESKSKKEFFLDEVGDDIELDLEEVGEEVDDIFTKSLNRSVDESNEDSFDKGSNRNIGLQIGSNPSPPKSRPVSKPEKSSDFDETDFHSDWDLKTALETASKSLKKPRPMPPPNQQAEGSKTGSTSLWTPALIRNQPPASKTRVGYLPQDIDWEVDTPYVGRKDKGEMQRPTAQSKTVKNEQQACDVSPAAPFPVPEPEPLNTHRGSYKPVEMTQEKKEKFAHQKDALFPSAQSAVSNIPTQVSHVFNQPGMTSTGMMPPGAADFIRDETKERESYYSPKEHATAPPKVADDQTPSKSSESPKRYRKRHKEKKPKRKKDSSDDDSDSSESDDSSEDKKLPQEKEKDTDELEVLLFKKESLMKRVKLLMEQKAMMSSQREDIIKNHKGSKTNLASILKENSFLIKEIGKQIGNIGNIVKSINHDIEVKRGNLKQTSSAPKGRSESPHVSRETHKARYSAEKEKLGKKLMKPIERQESWSRDSNSRSPKGGLRRKRSESPSPSMSREGPKPAPPERKQSASPPRKRSVKSTLEGSKKPAGHQPSQYPASKHTEQVHYAPHEAQRTYIRYMDQGMHWCKLCSLFCETALEYVDHLMTESHLGRVKNDRKSWLCRASKEEKEPKPLNAHVVTVPIQGMEFLHSLTSFYCSLCDTFMRDKGEALRHPESKMHVSKYKIHRAQNPLFESTFLKAKTTAYAKYKVDEERKKMENELNLNEKTVSLENKLLKQIKEKYEKESKEERQSDSQDDAGRNCGSIRVASRGPRHSGDKKPSKGSDDSRRKSDSLRHSIDEPQTSQKYEPKESEGDSNVDNVGGHEKTSVEDQRESKYKEGSKDVDADRRPVSSKLPLIGKMPFLKRKSGMTKNKEQQSTPVEEQPKLKKESSEEYNLSEIIPLPKPEARDSDVRKASQKVEEIKKALTVKPVPKEKPVTVRPVAPPVECPVTSVGSEDKAMTKNIPDTPLLLDTEKTSETEEKDTHGSDLYDPLEAGDEDSSDGAAAATIEALDLLNIPLPGFKTSLDSQKTSSTPPLSETEDKYQPEDMEIESTPLILEEEGMEEGKICPLETVHPAGMIVHPGISLMAPPPVNLSNPPPHMNLSNPPPINLNNPPPPINLNNPPPPINLSTPPPPINLNPPPPMNLNNPPPPINLSNSPLPINLNTPPPPISLSNPLPIMSLNNLAPPMSSSDPPPPGTEEPVFSSRDEGNNIIPTGNVLPAFGPQEFISKSTPPPIDIQRQDSQIPLPPGTEDEHTTREIPTVSYSSGKLEDKVDEVDTQRHTLQLFSPKGNSMDVPISLSDNVIKGSLKSTKEPSKTPQRNKNLPHNREKESTPPPPGTEGFSSEADSLDRNESNKLSTSDLESLKSPSQSSDLEIYANKEKLKLSQESKSSPNVSKAESCSSNLLSNLDQFSDSESGVSENVQQDEKDSSGKCLTADTRQEELGSYPVRDIRSHSLSPKTSDKGNMATSHASMKKNSCTPSKEPDKESIITAHSITEERSRTPPREPDRVKGEAALAYKNEKSCSTLPPTELDPENVFSSNRSHEGPLTPPTKEIETEKIATPCESQEWSHKPQDQQSTVKSKGVASRAIMSESYTLPLKQSDTRNIASPCDSVEQLHTPLTEQSDTRNIASPCDSVEQLHTPLTEQSDTGDIAPPCDSVEQLHTPLTEQPDTGDIAPPCGSEQVHTPLTEQPDTGNIAPPCGSEEQVHTPLTEQPDTGNIAPPCGSEEQVHIPLTEQLDTGDIAPACGNEEKVHTPLTEQPDTRNIAPPCGSEGQLHTSLTEQPETRNIAPPCDRVEQLHTPITEQPDTGDIAPPCGSEEQVHIPLTEQPDTGDIAPACGSEERPHTTQTKEPDVGDKTISACTNEEGPFTHPPEILTALHGSDNKRSCTSPDLQPSTRNITASHDNEGNICTSPSLHLNTRVSTMAPGSDEERSCATPLTQLDAGSQATSQNDLLPQLDRDLSYSEGNSAVEFSTWARLMEKNELFESKTTPSDNENFSKNPSSQSSTVDTDDNKNKQDASSEDEGENIEYRSHALSSKQLDTGNIPSSSKLSVNQESAESLFSKEWRFNVQDSNSFSILKDSTQDSTEHCDIMIERNLAKKSDIIDKPESPVLKPKSPTQMINFHKSFEGMDIAELFLPSRTDSVCTQSISPSKFVSPHTEDKDTSDTVKNVSDIDEENSETIEGKTDDEQGINNEMDEKNQDSGVRIKEKKTVQDTSCGQSKEPLKEELETSTVECSDSSKDYHSQKSTDSETETFPHEISDEDGGTRSMQKVQKEGYTSDEASKETEDITVEESAASTDKTHSSEDEVVTTASKKGRKRKHQNTRKTPRKRVAQFEWAEEDESIPSRTNTSRSSAGRQTPSVVESPRPMRSSRRAAAAAIKAMAKNQDDTPPDSPPSDNDTDYSD